jgi:hypothetical protein
LLEKGADVVAKADELDDELDDDEEDDDEEDNDVRGR